MAVLPPGLKHGYQLGEPFDSERVYVEERDPALLRAVGAPLSEETYELLDHCDKAGTGNNDSRTQASEVTAQWQGKERLPAQLRVILAQIPEHFIFENVSPESAWVASSDELREQVAALPGRFEDQEEPRLYLGKSTSGVVAPKELKSAIELMLLVIDPNNERKPKYIDRKDVDDLLKDEDGLRYYRPDQIEAFRAVAAVLDAQIQEAPKATLPSLDLPELGEVRLSLVEIPLPRKRKVEVDLSLTYQLELTRTPTSSGLEYKRNGHVEITVPPGFKVIFRDREGERLLDEGTHRVLEQGNDKASIEVFDKLGKKITDRSFEAPELELSISLDDYAALPVAHNGTPVEPKLAGLEEPEGDEPTARWVYGVSMEEDAAKVARAGDLFRTPESRVANGRYRVELGGTQGQRNSTVDFEKYSDSLYRVSVNGSDPSWMVADRPHAGEAQDLCFTASAGNHDVTFDPRSGELTVAYYGPSSTVEITPRHLEREQQIKDPDEPKSAIAARMLWIGGNADGSDFDAVKAELADLPQELLFSLLRHGLEVNVCRDTIVDHRPELAGEHPRGAPPWVTWDASDGFYDWGNKSITVATTASGRYDRDLRSGALLKQVGHAIDDIGGNLSKSEAFRKAYRADLAELKKQDQAFLIQPGDDGPEQAFAETFVWYIDDREKLAPYPALLAYWNEELALQAILQKQSSE